MQTTLAVKRPSFLASVDAAHHFDPTRYCKKEKSLASVRHNCAVLGFSELQYIERAEALGYRHEYNDALLHAKTQHERYLLLKKLFDKGLVETFVFRACVAQIGQHSLSDTEFQELRRAISVNEDLVGLVDVFKYFFDQKRTLVAQVATHL
ncbi:MAG: hypothetical protein A2845_05305 [Candidatus Lloydbacteria bacterium RIFCSPHIGHO2_01_FULL_49_22]|uniref:Uncharacterized protein n=1 Tax=Candidatus Lloydbacteria bacterium RIFCSPHIGHO2_01_FULL_49_22 TaxID=1798658 RepID=A0A1G2CTY5_9BACT|nr:MAG: hypothetical protein A2845_05305 [Candidatus Lloydbacteria bacterium RIFCSPHIGHO2_01_FULL_49_22]OGZ09159.1 MAG: hypothetical protein A3C14_04210 [Candidatus Lloydbacteria bacterium RIFCSPHIGHO2_02_FULL_50_18]